MRILLGKNQLAFVPRNDVLKALCSAGRTFRLCVRIKQGLLRTGMVPDQ